MIRILLITAALSLAALAHPADVFRCEGPDGVMYSDHPCGDSAETVQVIDNRIGGSLDRNLPPPRQKEQTAESQLDKHEAQSREEACRFINSTDLRRYIIKEQVVKGMTRDHVRRAFGNPPETYTDPQEVWIYQTRYYGALYELTYVYFRDGCVERVVYRKP
ncbi:DUF4124 domain-containing protein [Marinobacter nitratireducens]|nr:DUF4124 domain-containing protein [Marinobacter nitratireducens]